MRFLTGIVVGATAVIYYASVKKLEVGKALLGDVAKFFSNFINNEPQR